MPALNSNLPSCAFINSGKASANAYNTILLKAIKVGSDCKYIKKRRKGKRPLCVTFASERDIELEGDVASGIADANVLEAA